MAATFGRRRLLGMLGGGAAMVMSACSGRGKPSVASSGNSTPGSAAVPATASAPADGGSLFSALDKVATALVAAGKAPGVALAVVEPSGTVARGYGMARPGVPVDRSTVMGLGSVTKTFTALAFASLVNAGQLHLDDTIDSYLPPGATLRSEVRGKVTLEMLATHTSSFPRALPDCPHAQCDTSDLARFLSRWSPATPPGTSFLYSNIAFGYLGTIIGQVAGTTWEELVARVVCTPLGMAETKYYPPPVPSGYAEGHNEKGDAEPPYVIDAFGAAGAFSSTAADMATYLSALVSPPAGLLPDVQLTEQPHFRLSANAQQCLAWTVTPAGSGGLAYTKDGSVAGFSCIMGFDPIAHRGYWIGTNLQGSLHQGAAKQLSDALGVVGGPALDDNPTD